MFTLNQKAFSLDQKTYPDVWCEHISHMRLSTLEIQWHGSASLPVTKITPKSAILYHEQKPYPLWFSCRGKSYPVTECEQ